MIGEKIPDFPAGCPPVDNLDSSRAKVGCAHHEQRTVATGKPGQPRKPLGPARSQLAAAAVPRRGGPRPRVPFGQQPSPPDPNLFTPKGPSPRIWIAIAAAVAVVALVLVSLQFFIGVDPDEDTLSERPVPTQPTATRTGNFKPFDGAATGVFELTATRWTEDGLEVDFRIEVDQVSEFSFFAYTNASRESFLPEGDPIVSASPEQPATGTLRLPMPNADSTIVLAGPRGNNAIQALPVEGT